MHSEHSVWVLTAGNRDDAGVVRSVHARREDAEAAAAELRDRSRSHWRPWRETLRTETETLWQGAGFIAVTRWEVQT